MLKQNETKWKKTPLFDAGRERGFMERICPVCKRPIAAENGICFFCDTGVEAEPLPASFDGNIPADTSRGGDGVPSGKESKKGRGEAGSSPGGWKRPGRNSPYALMSPLQYFGCILLMLIPFVGVGVAVLWALGHCRKENKKNLARAMLALKAFALLLFFVGSVLFRPYWQKVLYALASEPSPAIVSAPPGEKGTSRPDSSVAENEIAGWDANRPVTFFGFPSAKALNVLLGGSYYIKYTVFAFGNTQVREQAKAGGRFVEVETVSGKQIRVLTIDGIRYECDDEKKIYCVAGQGTEGQVTPFGGTLSALERVGSGQGQVNGVDCEYDEFALRGSGTGDVKRTVRLYVKNEVLQAIYMEEPLLGSQVMMQVQVLTEEPPAGLLTLPDTYTQVTYHEMMHPGAAV
ncbi:MAG: hypothetical protein ACOX0U_05315 [Oscillospiraceae bacterium]